jgi:Cu(I)/Ag(I) efflux system membrane fusion protein
MRAKFTKKNITLIIIGLLLIGGVSFSAKQIFFANNSSSKQQGYYTCSMHPSIREAKSGRCPICGMNLTYIEEVTGLGHETHDHESVNELAEMTQMSEDSMGGKHKNHSANKEVATKDGDAAVRLTKKQVYNFNYTTFEVRKEKISRTLRLLGKVVQSEKKQSNIPARISGRVEKVYINSTGSFVSKNDPVIDIYSPELITAGEEYLVSSKRNQRDLLRQAKKKLKLWGIRDFQIRDWLKNSRVPRNITIYSNASGVVTRKRAVEGRYFKEGESFYDLVNLSTVWVEMDVYEQDAGLVKIGQNVNMEFLSYPGERWKSRIDFISPVLDEKTRTLTIRSSLDNKDGKLKPGMVGEINLVNDTSEDVPIIPNSAIIDTGKRKIVWLEKDKNNYIATEIETGIQGVEFSEVKSGLNEGENIVVDGNFLLDAQSQLSGNNIVHNH